MLYVRVPENCDGTVLTPEHRKGQPRCLLGGELFTVREYAKLIRQYKNMPKLTQTLFGLPKSKTYTIFSNRFPEDDITILLYGTPACEDMCYDMLYLIEEQRRKIMKNKGGHTECYWVK